MAPDPATGRQLCNPVKSLAEMSPEEVFDRVKNKTVEAGGKVVDLGGKAINTIHDKISNGDLTEGAKSVGEKITNQAKGIW